MDKVKDYYDLFGVSRNATQAQIKKAFRELALRLHPDKNQGHDANTIFAHINKAYAILSTPSKRREYDICLPGNLSDHLFNDDDDDDNVPGEVVYVTGAEAPSVALKKRIEMWRLQGHPTNPVAKAHELFKDLTDNLGAEEMEDMARRAKVTRQHMEKKFRCSLCPLSYSSIELLETHCAKAHDPYDDLLAALKAAAPPSLAAFVGASKGKEEEEFSLAPLLTCTLNELQAVETTIVSTRAAWRKLPFAEKQLSLSEWLATLPNNDLENPSEWWPPSPKASASEPWALDASNVVTQPWRASPLESKQLRGAINGNQPGFFQRIRDSKEKADVAPFFNAPILLESSLPKVAKEILSGVPMPTISVKPLPDWVPDRGFGTCHACGNINSIPYNSSHCRACGDLFCLPCVGKFRRLPVFGLIYQSVRVCNSCLLTVMLAEAMAWRTAAMAPEIPVTAKDVLIEIAHHLYPNEIWQSVELEMQETLREEVELGIRSKILNDQQWMSLAKRCIHENQPTLLSECIAVSGLDSDIWISLARSLDANQCMFIYMTLALDPTSLLKEAQHHFTAKRAKLSWECLLAAANAGITSSDMLTMAIEQIKDHNILLGLQVARAAKLNLADWLALASHIPRTSDNGPAFQIWHLSYLHCLEQSEAKQRQQAVHQAFNTNQADIALETLAFLAPLPDIMLSLFINRLRENDIQSAKGLLPYCIPAGNEMPSDGLKCLAIHLHHILAEMSPLISLEDIFIRLGRHLFSQPGQDLLTHACFVISDGPNGAASQWDVMASQLMADGHLQLALRSRLIAATLTTQTSAASTQMDRTLSLAEALLANKEPGWALATLSILISSSIDQVPQLHLLVADCLETQKHSASLIVSALLRAQSQSVLTAQTQARLKHLQKEASKERSTSASEDVFQSFQQQDYAAMASKLLCLWQKNDSTSVGSFLAQLLKRAGIYLNQMRAPDKAVLSLVRGMHCLMRDGSIICALEELSAATLQFGYNESMASVLSTVLSSDVVQTALVDQITKSVANVGAALLDPNTPPETPLFCLPSPLKSLPKASFLRYLRATRPLCALRRCERTVAKDHGDKRPRETALYYVDLALAAPESSSTLTCLLLAARSFIVHLQTCGNSKADQYAYKCAAMECLRNACSSAQYQTIGFQLYVARWALSLVLKAHQLAARCFESTDIGLAARITMTIARLLPFFPVVYLPALPASDTVYLSSVLRMLTKQCLHQMAGSFGAYPETPRVLTAKDVAYQIHEGRWHGWLCEPYPDDSDDDSEEDTQKDHKSKADKDKRAEEREQTWMKKMENDASDSRATCMVEMLHERNWKVVHVEKLVQWMGLPRDAKGFLLAKEYSLPNKNFYSVDGFSFDMQTGKIAILAKPANPCKGEPGLFSWSDVSEVMCKSISSTFFSLNDPDLHRHAHPFQEMIYAPSGLCDTEFLATMLHTDYLLKFFSTGVEVSGQSPFAIRSVTEGLLDRLPPTLRHSVRSVPNRRRSSKIGKAHRFWIEAGEIPLDDTDPNQIRFGHVPMRVKSHLMVRNDKGELVDAPVEEEDDTAEAEFARDLTCNYDKIGQYFPELLRLRELYKLAAIYHIISVRVSRMTELSNAVPTSPLWKETLDAYTSEISSNLHEIRSKIGSWPSADDPYAVEENVRQLVDLNREAVRQRGRSWVESQVRPKVKSQMQTADNMVLHHLTSEFQLEGEQELVRNYLQYGNINDLANRVSLKKVERQRTQILEALQQVQKLGIAIENKKMGPASAPFSDTSCNWVPAAFVKDTMSAGYSVMVYGGVSLNIAFNRQPLINPSPSSTYFLSNQTLNAQRNIAAPNSAAQLLDNYRLANLSNFQGPQNPQQPPPSCPAGRPPGRPPGNPSGSPPGSPPGSPRGRWTYTEGIRFNPKFGYEEKYGIRKGPDGKTVFSFTRRPDTASSPLFYGTQKNHTTWHNSPKTPDDPYQVWVTKDGKSKRDGSWK